VTEGFFADMASALVSTFFQASVASSILPLAIAAQRSFLRPPATALSIQPCKRLPSPSKSSGHK